MLSTLYSPTVNLPSSVSLAWLLRAHLRPSNKGVLALSESKYLRKFPTKIYVSVLNCAYLSHHHSIESITQCGLTSHTALLDLRLAIQCK